MQSKSKSQILARLDEQIRDSSKSLRDLVSKPLIQASPFEERRRELLAKKYQAQLNDARARKKNLQLS